MIYRVLTALLLGASALAQSVPTLDETAHFLAGMPVTGVLEPLTHDPAWQEHAQAMNEAWTRKEQQQIWPIRQWMQANAPQYHRSNDTVFYMFSGPDFLYSSIFFPLSSNYVLAGLEPIGNVPDLTHVPPEVVRADLISLRNSMNSILRFQYFITKEMRTDLGRGNISGTLPILYVFLARLGYTIVDVTHVGTPAEGVKITFSGGEQSQTLYYFKTDLSGGNSAFLRWCAARGPGLSLLKAASFLMHGDGFSGVRNFLVQNSRVIIQESSKNIISLISPRSSARTRRRSVLPSAIIGKKRTASSWLPRAKLYRRSQPRSNRKKCASENDPPLACRTTISCSEGMT